MVQNVSKTLTYHIIFGLSFSMMELPLKMGIVPCTPEHVVFPIKIGNYLVSEIRLWTWLKTVPSRKKYQPPVTSES